MSGGGRFDFDDGGTYCGGWEDGKAHGHGVCTGPKGQGEYSGAWQFGFEASGVYTWPSGNSFKGQWMQGKRHGLGIETKGRWVYRGEWTQGFKGRYGVRQSTSSGAKYEGTWTTGLQDGYGVETYADGGHDSPADGSYPYGTFQGQWLRGMRHGYGVRQSVPYGLASHYRPEAMRASLTSIRSEQEDEKVVKDRDRKIDESRGGFVLKAKSDESPTTRRRSLFNKQGRSSLRKTLISGLKLRKQKSTGDIQDSPRRPTGSVRSTISNISHTSADSSQSGVTSASMYTDSNHSFVSQDDINDVNVTETYTGEWKNDKRSGFGISERSDGLRYEGEWYNNKKYGYGVTTFKDGTKEEGKYKNNLLISSGKKSKLFLIRSSKLRERVDNAVSTAQRASAIAQQKADIAITRMANARAKAEAADVAAANSQQDSDLARIKAKEFAPEFHQPDYARAAAQRARDCALAGSSSQIAANLNQLEHHRGDHNKPGHHLPNAHGRDRYDGGRDLRDIPIEPRNVSPTDLAFAAPPRGGGYRDRRYADQNSLPNAPFGSQDYHRTNDRDSGFERELDTPSEERSTSTLPTPTYGAQYYDRSPDSLLSETDELYRFKTRPLQRRKTLPSIMKAIIPPVTNTPAVGAPAVKGKNPRQSAQSSGTVKVEPETYVIENGIRKRVKAEVYNPPPRQTLSDESPKALPNRYKLEGQSAMQRRANRGSLPDVSACMEELQKKITPREEMSKLSSARREELRRLHEEEERRRQQEIVLRLTDLKDWCQQRQLLMLVIALNVSLATMFFNLLSQ